jgi:hypothetical protein
MKAVQLLRQHFLPMRGCLTKQDMLVLQTRDRCVIVLSFNVGAAKMIVGQSNAKGGGAVMLWPVGWSPTWR